MNQFVPLLPNCMYNTINYIFIFCIFLIPFSSFYDTKRNDNIWGDDQFENKDSTISEPTFICQYIVHMVDYLRSEIKNIHLAW